MLVLSTTNPAIQLTGRSLRFFATQQKSRLTIKKFYQILGVAEDCEDETLRLAFVDLAKKFHPDSSAKEASAIRFSEIQNAYRQIQRHRFETREKETSGLYPDVEEFDIKHTAPQHRHYLVHDVGVGTPSMRQRRFVADRAQKAVLNVMEHRLKTIQSAERNTLVGMDKQRAKDIKTRYGMDRLVEDLIQESMNKGEFNDLKGMGKPLKQDTCGQNPYVDFVTHKLNQVLLDNGFTPEWIQLSKEIRQDTETLKKQLEETRNKLGDMPLSYHDEEKWKNTLQDVIKEVKRINKNIDKYNLIVPILQKQMLQINLKSLADNALAKPPSVDKNLIEKSKIQRSLLESNSESVSIIQMLSYIFSK
ncbi:dnaJ homolog subfamily C member 28 [Phymastichus coffea]|uniref:dnaJ homolog subfamily C member 28 n=1 Tax=Phymastichus coffea TaxID=108790 RepID=UPI00273C02B9|nr:dnaJ homolog subfamily C member 28 [Phymastichus coffea]